MADTFTKLYIHIVFSTRKRNRIIKPSFKDKLHKYIGGIIKMEGQFPIIINSMPDHIHILLAMKPNHLLSDLVSKVKSNSSKWLNESYSFYKDDFAWQNGYGAFTCSPLHLDRVIHYIENQEMHHAKKRFDEEYIQLLEESDIEYNRPYALDA